MPRASTRRACPRRPAGRDTIRVPLPPRADSVSARRHDTRRARSRSRRDTSSRRSHARSCRRFSRSARHRIYDRAALFATGALTLADLLGRVPASPSSPRDGSARRAARSRRLPPRARLLRRHRARPAGPRARGVAGGDDIPLVHARGSAHRARRRRGARLRSDAGASTARRRTRAPTSPPATRTRTSTAASSAGGSRTARRSRSRAAVQHAADPRAAVDDALNLMLALGTARGPWSVDCSRAEQAESRAVGRVSETRSRRSTRFRRLEPCDRRRTRGSATAIPSAAAGSSSWRQRTGFRLSPRESNEFLSTVDPDRDSGVGARLRRRTSASTCCRRGTVSARSR